MIVISMFVLLSILIVLLLGGRNLFMIANLAVSYRLVLHV